MIVLLALSNERTKVPLYWDCKRQQSACKNSNFITTYLVLPHICEHADVPDDRNCEDIPRICAAFFLTNGQIRQKRSDNTRQKRNKNGTSSKIRLFNFKILSPTVEGIFFAPVQLKPTSEYTNTEDYKST